MALTIADLPIGSIVIDMDTIYDDNHIQFVVAAKDHKKFKCPTKNITTLITKNVIDLKCFDSCELENEDEKIKKSGNNNYIKSNIHRWLNSINEDWFKPAHKHDAPPTKESVGMHYRDYHNEKGFLSNIGELLLNSIVETRIDIYCDSTHDKKATRERDLFFLPDMSDIISFEDTNLVLPLFQRREHVVSYPSIKCAKRNYRLDIDIHEEKPCSYWLRTPYRDSKHKVYAINRSGILSVTEPKFSHHGVRPMCNIMSNVRVARTNDIGTYVLI